MISAWLLPEHIEDILPPYARAAEELRRRLLDLFDGYGYDLVCPPMVEYLDSLLTGAASDLDLNTFKVVDAASGRMMGLRADITPQTCRIDAHLLNRHGVTRLCYAGSVLHTRPAGFHSSREPFQIGAELFGHAGMEADREILVLLLSALKLAGIPDARVSLGHVGLFRELAHNAGLLPGEAAALFAALKLKDVPEVVRLTESVSEPWQPALRALPELYGGPEILHRAAYILPPTHAVRAAIEELDRLMQVDTGIPVSLDLSDLRGFGYHNGVTFAAYAGGQARAVALGGRYDGAGAVFGRSRPATGFSLDLRQILDCLPEPARRGGILAPCDNDAALLTRIAELRAAGERVLVELPGQEQHRPESGCERILVRTADRWQIKSLS